MICWNTKPVLFSLVRNHDMYTGHMLLEVMSTTPAPLKTPREDFVGLL